MRSPLGALVCLLTLAGCYPRDVTVDLFRHEIYLTVKPEASRAACPELPPLGEACLAYRGLAPEARATVDAMLDGVLLCPVVPSTVEGEPNDGTRPTRH